MSSNSMGPPPPPLPNHSLAGAQMLLNIDRDHERIILAQFRSYLEYLTCRVADTGDGHHQLYRWYQFGTDRLLPSEDLLPREQIAPVYDQSNGEYIGQKLLARPEDAEQMGLEPNAGYSYVILVEGVNFRAAGLKGLLRKRVAKALSVPLPQGQQYTLEDYEITEESIIVSGNFVDEVIQVLNKLANDAKELTEQIDAGVIEDPLPSWQSG